MPRRGAAGLLIAGLFATPSLADEPAIPEVVYPKLRPTASSPDGFVPAGWRVEARAAGDLNHDGRADTVMVLRQTSRRNIVKPFAHSPDTTFDTNPRMIAVAFAGAAGQPWRLAAENHVLIPRDTEPSMVETFDPEAGLQVAKAMFRIRLTFFADAIWRSSFTFRHEGGRFVLVRYTMKSRHRFSAETREVDIDYARGRVRTETGLDSEDAPPVKVSTGPVPKRPRPTLDDVGDAVAFENNL